MASNSFEMFDIVEIDRKQIKFADYNPRDISGKAKKKLKDNIEKIGMVEPVVFNKRTGNLVSGHQRVGILDSLHKGKDYRLMVSMVDLDEKTEREQNIFMNNGEAQGFFDLNKLDAMKLDVDFSLAGFDEANIFKMFGDDPENAPPDELLKMAEKVKETIERTEKIKEASQDRDNPNFFLVVVFPSYEDRKKFTDKYGLEDNRFLSREDFEAVIEKEKAGTDPA